jgi:hypothetical protein
LEIHIDSCRKDLREIIYKIGYLSIIICLIGETEKKLPKTHCYFITGIPQQVVEGYYKNEPGSFVQSLPPSAFIASLRIHGSWKRKPA